MFFLQNFRKKHFTFFPSADASMKLNFRTFKYNVRIIHMNYITFVNENKLRTFCEICGSYSTYYPLPRRRVEAE
jgi:hypothetical protein